MWVMYSLLKRRLQEGKSTENGLFSLKSPARIVAPSPQATLSLPVTSLNREVAQLF